MNSKLPAQTGPDAKQYLDAHPHAGGMAFVNPDDPDQWMWMESASLADLEVQR